MQSLKGFIGFDRLPWWSLVFFKWTRCIRSPCFPCSKPRTSSVSTNHDAISSCTNSEGTQGGFQKFLSHENLIFIGGHRIIDDGYSVMSVILWCRWHDFIMLATFLVISSKYLIGHQQKLISSLPSVTNIDVARSNSWIESMTGNWPEI